MKSSSRENFTQINNTFGLRSENFDFLACEQTNIVFAQASPLFKAIVFDDTNNDKDNIWSYKVNQSLVRL